MNPDQENTRATYDNIAKDWHDDHQGDDWWVEEMEKFTRLLKPGGLILDGGCAGGTKAKFLLAKGFQVVGIDASQNMIEIAKKENPTGRFEVLELENVETLAETFDGILLQAVLLHFSKKDVLEVLKKIVAKVAPGGYIYATVKGRQPEDPEEEVKTETEYGQTFQRFFSYFSLAELKELFLNAGLNIIDINIKATGKTKWLHIVGKK